MCVTCGCLRPDDDHGDPANITLENLMQAAATAGVTLTEAIENIRDTLELAQGRTGVATV